MSTALLPHDHGTAFDPQQLPGTEDFVRVAELFKLLCDPSRVRIFWLLCHCSQCVTNISALVQMSSPAVSHHLRLLTQAGLISRSRQGKEVYYTASDSPTVQLLHAMVEQLEQLRCLTAQQ